MRRRAEAIRLGAKPTRTVDARWPDASSVRGTRGRGLLASLVVHGGLAAVAVLAAALTVGAPGPTVDVVEMAWIETPAAEPSDSRAAVAESAEPVETPMAEPALAAAEPVTEPPVPEPVEPEPVPPEPIVPEPVVAQAEPEPIREQIVEPPPEPLPEPLAEPLPEPLAEPLPEPLPVPPVPVVAPPPPRPPAPPKPVPPRPVAHRPGPNTETVAVAAGPSAAATQATPQPAQAAPVVSPSWNAALAAWLHRNKTYPSAARSRGEQGSGQVRFTVARDGRVLAVELVGTTGSRSLDDAVHHLLNGATVPAFPADMPHAEVTVNVRINYSLRRGDPGQ